MRTGLPVMKTVFSHRENTIFITGMGLQRGSQSQLSFQLRILNTDYVSLHPKKLLCI